MASLTPIAGAGLGPVDWLSNTMTGSALEAAIVVSAMWLLADDRLPVPIQIGIPVPVVLGAPLLLFRSAYAASVQALFATEGETETFWMLSRRLLDLLSGVAVVIIAFGMIYRVSGLRMSNAVEGQDPAVISRLDCVYYSAIVWTTVGFGDIVPLRRGTRLISAFEALMGYFTLGVAFAEFSPIAVAMVRLRLSAPG